MHFFANCLCAVARCLASKPAKPQAAHDWPGFLGPQRNGKSAERGLPASWPAAGRRSSGRRRSAPAMPRRRSATAGCFTSPASTTPPGSPASMRKPAHELWTCDYPTDYEDMLGYNNGPRATPVVDGAHVYTFSAEGILQCVRVADGQPVWRLDTMKDFHVVKNFFGVGSTPLVWGDLLLVNVGGSPPGSPPDVYARERQRATRPGRPSSRSTKRPAKSAGKRATTWPATPVPSLAKIGGRDIVFMFARGGLLAIDPAKGETIANFPGGPGILESVNASTPVVVGRRSVHLRNVRARQRAGAIHRQRV